MANDTPITEADVAKVARLGRLDIDALDLDSVQPMTQPYPLVNVMRDDVELPTLDTDEVLAMAPAAEERRFRVPPIIGLDG